MIKAVVFDAYGTLFEIGDQRSPYKKLLVKAKEIGRKPRPDDAIKIMTKNMDIWSIATYLGLSLSASEKRTIKNELESELKSIRIYPDMIATLRALQKNGLRLAICSNLAKPYAQPILSLLPFAFDAYIWSFEVGAVKPDQRIYQSVCQSLNLRAEEILMVGDTIEADCAGPRRNGMSAIHLSRTNSSTDPHFIASLDELMPYLDKFHA